MNKDVLLAHLRTVFGYSEGQLSIDPESWTFDAECAIYWFAADYHSGQASDLYAVLSSSDYHPGPMERGPEGLAFDMYASLIAQFVAESDTKD